MNNTQTQEFKPGDKVRFRMGDSIYGAPNFPRIPMTVTGVEQSPDGATQVKYSQQWYYNGFGGQTDAKWLELVPDPL